MRKPQCLAEAEKEAETKAQQQTINASYAAAEEQKAQLQTITAGQGEPKAGGRPRTRLSNGYHPLVPPTSVTHLG